MYAAELTTINPRKVAMQHLRENHRVAALVEHVKAVGSWDCDPILVIEDDGNGYTILDGHHRTGAAQELAGDGEIDVRQIPAYVVSVADYCAILDEHFGGCSPDRINDIREHIVCDGKSGNDIARHTVVESLINW